MNRRTFVTGAGVLAAGGLAGCVGFGLGNGGRGYELELDRIPDDDLLTALALTAEEQSAEERKLVAGAVDGEYRTHVHTSIEDGDFVEHDGAYYRVRVAENTYTAETVADSASAFRAFLEAEYVTAQFDRSKLSSQERAILEKARTDSYHEHGELSAAFRAVLERIGGGEIPESARRHYVRYDGRVYEAELMISVP